MRLHFPLIVLLGLTLGAAPACAVGSPAKPIPSDPREKHIVNIRQLTFGGSNAEAYYSPDGQWLTFQSTRDGRQCDQIYRMRIDGSDLKMVSTGKGRTTCSYSFPDGKRILYGSTHLGGADCPPRPDFSKGYVWPVFATYDIFFANVDGSDPKRITQADGYDAEATLSVDGQNMVFTSMRDGDLELYSMKVDGTGIKRLTHDVGYDGGAFYSRDGKKIIYRAHHPQNDKEKVDYHDLLAKNLFRPTWLEVFIMDADGSNKVQVTHNRAANFCPYFYPDGKRIIFASNQNGGGRKFNLWACDLDGKNMEQITFQDNFEAFPMFSPDGKSIVWGSNRTAKGPHETNVMIADWKP